MTTESSEWMGPGKAHRIGLIDRYRSVSIAWTYFDVYIPYSCHAHRI